MARHLLFAVHLYADGMGTARYHGMGQGAPEWPPAPGRLFQAMVAGVARGESLPQPAVAALEWMANLPPPVIAAPRATLGQSISLYVPNNDADALADPSDLSSIRTAKTVHPRLFDASAPLLYAWPLPGTDAHEAVLIDTAHKLYQLGRGVDMAWANAQVVTEDALQSLLSTYPGTIHRPTIGAASMRTLACPCPGTLDSLIRRHRASRFQVEGNGRKARWLFTNPPKPRFLSVNYAPRSHRSLFELRELETARPWPWPLHRATTLVERVRDAAASRLVASLGEAEVIERCLIGRAADGSGAVSLSERVRILPLPSIGASHADHAIRRVLVEVQGACPLAADDVDWAFSGLQATDPETGELSAWVLAKADRPDMMDHYIGPAHDWQSVTAVVLPEHARRRRIDPAHRVEQAKVARERMDEEARAVAAVHEALRHAGVIGTAVQVQVRREPFVGQGQRAESFAASTRFAKERLWHVAMRFDRPLAGPMVIGDGRFLGLGVLAPADAAGGRWASPGSTLSAHTDGIFVLQAQARGANATEDAVALARAVRRAVLSRVRDVKRLGPDAGLPSYFSGHAAEDPTADADGGRHLAFHWDPPRGRWLVIAPHRLQRHSAAHAAQGHLSTLAQALEGLHVLLAGRAGRFAVQLVPIPMEDPLLSVHEQWESVTPYVVTRHRRMGSASEALVADVIGECRRCGLPTPAVTVLNITSAPGLGLQGLLRLHFGHAISGPIALGRTGLLGGGLFGARGLESRKVASQASDHFTSTPIPSQS